jgi:transcriptional regulator with XRE-family HTH domain
MINLDEKLPQDYATGIAQRARQQRRELGLSQAQLATKSGVSLGSLKRFEREGKISLESLIKLAIALSSTNEIDALFSQRRYRTIQEVIDANR